MGLLLAVRVKLTLCLEQKIDILREITELRARRRGSGSKVCTQLGLFPVSSLLQTHYTVFSEIEW